MTRKELNEIFEPLLAPHSAPLRKLSLDAAWSLCKRFDPADALVYDNYNFVVCGWTFTGRPSDAFLSIAVACDHASLCFLQGVHLNDPEKRMRGGGNLVRSIRLESVATLSDPYVDNLIDQAGGRAKKGDSSGKVVLRSVSVKKRRPSTVLEAGNKT